MYAFKIINIALLSISQALNTWSYAFWGIVNMYAKQTHMQQSGGFSIVTVWPPYYTQSSKNSSDKILHHRYQFERMPHHLSYSCMDCMWYARFKSFK